VPEVIDPTYKKKAQHDLSGLMQRYRHDYVVGGLKLPLDGVPVSASGLLELLPNVEARTGWPFDQQVDPGKYANADKWPLLSIIVPTFNQGEFIEEALRSILLQNYPRLELILIDGGSTDDTPKILEQYSPWLSFRQHKPDRGQGHALNLGFSVAGGDYLGWLNSDDFYNPGAFYILGSEIAKSKKSFYYGDALCVNRENSVRNYWKGFWVLDSFLRFGGLIASHSAFWSREIHQPIWERMNCNVDAELWIRMVPKTSRKHIRFPLGSVRLYDDSKSGSVSWKNKWKEDDENIDRVHGRPPRPRSLLAYSFRFIQKIYRRLNHNAINTFQI
jgi:glycosyltransferase involved in cell wall biosynthesis